MTKRDDVLAKLREGWVTVPTLLETTGWKSHTLRGVLSNAKKSGLNVERKREDGVTSYRVVAA